eukprot:NODE_6078_length_608_cov_56.300537_g5673_i0.p2 GENE.NODE_6078_length_608_cov_56.300537_g5673_i0~~NODE_6078_length_608_cov_56.300537_g5673_i0.p2  ORF type:complete len:109 (-),score=4.66 NODE_6078_length_608_cov_56.300537_g5673_i0:112-438(-)
MGKERGKKQEGTICPFAHRAFAFDLRHLYCFLLPSSVPLRENFLPAAGRGGKHAASFTSLFFSLFAVPSPPLSAQISHSTQITIIHFSSISSFHSLSDHNSRTHSTHS